MKLPLVSSHGGQNVVTYTLTHNLLPKNDILCVWSCHCPKHKAGHIYVKLRNMNQWSER